MSTKVNTDTPSTLDSLEAKLVNDVWYVQQPGSSYWGKGATIEASVADLSQRTTDYKAFAKESGLPAFEIRALAANSGSMFQNFWRNVRILGFVALCCIPISYAISSGLYRIIKEPDIRGDKQFWSKVENRILSMGADGKGLPPEKADALHHAISNIVDRARPFTSKFGLLFIPPESDAPAGIMPKRE